jgi:hypothetical protein
MAALSFVIISQAMRDTVMIDGVNEPICVIPAAELWDDYYACLHGAYNALNDTFLAWGSTQDELAARLGIDKSLVSKRLNGRENLTIKTMSHMGTGMGYRLVMYYVPYDQLGTSNYYIQTPAHLTSASSGIKISTADAPTATISATTTTPLVYAR